MTQIIQNLVQPLSNLRTDFLIFVFNIKQSIDIYLYTSSVQAKVFSIIKQLNGSMNGYRRYSINNIVSNIMLLQELLIDKDGNSLNYYKIQKVKRFTKYILSRNNFVNDTFVMPVTNINQIQLIINEIVDNLSTDNYLNENEIKKIIKTHRIQLKYRK